MAKVAANGKSLGKSNVVKFPSEIYMESMIYKNGEFNIQYPGYYEVSINFRSVRRSFQAELMINNKTGFLFGEKNGKGSMNMSTIVKLEVNDKVHVRIRNGKTSRFPGGNNFSIRKID